jgi:hypothetical protein
MASADRRRWLPALALFAAIVALGFAGKLLPSLLKETRATSSTPVRREGRAGDVPFRLAPAQRACLVAVPLDRDSGVAQLWVRRAPAPAATLELTAAAPGYGAVGRVQVAPHDVRDQEPPISIPLAPPRHSTVGTVCVRNAGTSDVELIGTAQARALTHSAVVLDGVRQPRAFSLRLLDAHRRDMLARAPQLVDRAAALSPFGPWLFWALIPLLALGLPLLVGTALYRALREPEPAGTRDEVA